MFVSWFFRGTIKYYPYTSNIEFSIKLPNRFILIMLILTIEIKI